MQKKIVILLLGAALAVGTAGTASASTWAQRHPRRDEVNHRLANQNRRIDRDLADGKITQQQAHQLHRDDRSIRSAERTDASFDHSHLTRADQRSLNQDENGASRDIYQDAH